MRAVVLAIVGLCGLGASTASAATVTVALDARFGSFNQVQYAAAPGETNDLVAAYAADALSVTVTDPGAVITALGSCTSLSAHSAVCRAPNPPFRVAGEFVQDVRAELGDGNDRARTTRPGPNVIGGIDAFGGPGDDVLTGSPTTDHLNGGGGRDMLLGNAGGDVLSDGDRDGAPAGLGPDADVLDGGSAKTDTISYAQRTNAVTVDLANDGPDGAPGENDVVRGLEWATGGAGDDRLAGDERDNILDGGPGLNRLVGRDGDDFLDRASGAVARCGRGTDFTSGPRARTLIPAACEQLTLRKPRALADTRATLRPTPLRRRGRPGFDVSCPDLDGEPVGCRATVRIRTRAGRLLASGKLGAPKNEEDRDRFLRLDLTPLGQRLRGNGRRDLARVVIRGRISRTVRWTIGF